MTLSVHVICCKKELLQGAIYYYHSIQWAKRMSGTVANGTLPGCKYKSEVSILGFRWNFWFVIESIAYED